MARMPGSPGPPRCAEDRLLDTGGLTDIAPKGALGLSLAEERGTSALSYVCGTSDTPLRGSCIGQALDDTAEKYGEHAAPVVRHESNASPTASSERTWSMRREAC